MRLKSSSFPRSPLAGKGPGGPPTEPRRALPIDRLGAFKKVKAAEGNALYLVLNDGGNGVHPGGRPARAAAFARPPGPSALGPPPGGPLYNTYNPFRD